jgi:hypothetical protein
VARDVAGNAIRAKSDPAINAVIGGDLDAFMKVMTGNG